MHHASDPVPPPRLHLGGRSLSVVGRARIYVCGVTPYDVTHLGHAATFVWVDAADRLLRRLGEAGVDVDRSGAGGIAEVYPGAALRLWGFDTRGYKVDAAARETLVGGLSASAPWLDLAEHRALMIRSADALDAVVAALITRAAALGRYVAPQAGEQLARARREGWIVLPDGGLGELVR